MMKSASPYAPLLLFYIEPCAVIFSPRSSRPHPCMVRVSEMNTEYKPEPFRTCEKWLSQMVMWNTCASHCESRSAGQTGKSRFGLEESIQLDPRVLLVTPKRMHG